MGRGGHGWLGAMVAVLAACAHQAPLPTAGLEESVLPLFVRDAAARLPFELAESSDGMRVCGALFVGEHELVTARGVFPDEEPLGEADEAFLADGSLPRSVVRLDRTEDPLGLAVLRAEEGGRPLELRKAPVKPGERLVRIAFRFHRDASAVAELAEWDEAAAFVVTPPEGGTFLATTVLHAGLCGAALLDEEGRLVGIVVGGEGTRVVVRDAQAIREAMTLARGGR